MESGFNWIQYIEWKRQRILNVYRFFLSRVRRTRKLVAVSDMVQIMIRNIQCVADAVSWMISRISRWTFFKAEECDCDINFLFQFVGVCISVLCVFGLWNNIGCHESYFRPLAMWQEMWWRRRRRSRGEIQTVFVSVGDEDLLRDVLISIFISHPKTRDADEWFRIHRIISNAIRALDFW